MTAGYVVDLVDAANSEQPPTLRVTGGPALASDTLLENLQPIAEPAQGEVVGRLPSPETGPQHWGGANLSPYDPGSIAARPFPTGPLLPTSLGLRAPPVLENARALSDQGGDQGRALVPAAPGNEPPRFSGTSPIERELGEITVTPQVASAQPFPTLGEGARLADARINGVDQGNLTLGRSGDAAIVFGSEFASFANTLGVYLIGPDGQMVDPRIVFDGAADPDDIDPFVRFDAAGDDVQVSVDQDGAGADFAFISFATLVDPSGVTTAQDAAANGSLVV
jgi:hypothetical protein